MKGVNAGTHARKTGTLIEDWALVLIYLGSNTFPRTSSVLTRYHVQNSTWKRPRVDCLLGKSRNCTQWPWQKKLWGGNFSTKSLWLLCCHRPLFTVSSFGKVVWKGILSHVWCPEWGFLEARFMASVVFIRLRILENFFPSNQFWGNFFQPLYIIKRTWFMCIFV